MSTSVEKKPSSHRGIMMRIALQWECTCHSKVGIFSEVTTRGFIFLSGWLIACFIELRVWCSTGWPQTFSKAEDDSGFPILLQPPKWWDHSTVYCVSVPGWFDRDRVSLYIQFNVPWNSLRSSDWPWIRSNPLPLLSSKHWDSGHVLLHQLGDCLKM